MDDLSTPQAAPPSAVYVFSAQLAFIARHLERVGRCWYRSEPDQTTPIPQHVGSVVIVTTATEHRQWKRTVGRLRRANHDVYCAVLPPGEQLLDDCENGDVVRLLDSSVAPWDEGFAVGPAWKQGLSPLTAQELLTTTFEPVENILAPWLPVKGLAMIYGPRGIGKTHVALGIACSIAAGSSFLGWTAPKPRRVIIIDGEMPAAVLQQRLAEAVTRGNYDIEPDNLRICAADLEPDGLPDLASPELATLF